MADPVSGNQVLSILRQNFTSDRLFKAMFHKYLTRDTRKSYTVSGLILFLICATTYMFMSKIGRPARGVLRGKRLVKYPRPPGNSPLLDEC